MLLQVAAAADGDVLTEILRAAEALGEVRPELADLDPAIDAGLIHVDGPALRFRHSLVRSAVYQATSIAERTAAHWALAVVLADHPDRRVWHRASAALSRDPQIAAELEACAERSADRGDLVTAVAGYQRAAELSTDTTRRGALKLRAAEVASELGLSELVRRLLHEASTQDLGPAEHLETRQGAARRHEEQEIGPGAAHVRVGSGGRGHHRSPGVEVDPPLGGPIRGVKVECATDASDAAPSFLFLVSPTGRAVVVVRACPGQKSG